MTRANFSQPMPFKATLLLILPALTAVLQAEVPQKRPLGNYANLWTNSPFTAKPPVAGAGPIANPLDDYSLLGVSPIADGYRVTLASKKQPDKRIVVESGRTSEGFAIIKVNREAGQPLKTTVEMSSGAQKGVVSFDSNFIKITTPPPNNPQALGQGAPQVQGQPAPNQQNQQIIQRQPRPRVVPPPAPGAPNANPAANQFQGQIQGQRPNSRPFNRRR